MRPSRGAETHEERRDEGYDTPRSGDDECAPRVILRQVVSLLVCSSYYWSPLAFLASSLLIIISARCFVLSTRRRCSRPFLPPLQQITASDHANSAGFVTRFVTVLVFFGAKINRHITFLVKPSQRPYRVHGVTPTGCSKVNVVAPAGCSNSSLAS